MQKIVLKLGGDHDGAQCLRHVCKCRQESPREPAEMAQADGNVMEETVVLGRLQSAAQSLLQDRIEDDALVDSLDSETISRMGDSTVAASLRRVSGLTLVNDKFVYVRV